MLQIHKEQYEILKQKGGGAFENLMLEHLADFSPPLYKTLGEKQLRIVIRSGIERAENYGFNQQGSVRTYLELMLLFGSYFDTDPQYPWAGEILADANEAEQMELAEQLHERTMEYRQQVTGEDDEFTLQALNRIRQFGQESPQIPATGFQTALLNELKRIYPEKYDYVGQPSFEKLIKKGVQIAQKNHLQTTHDAALMVVLMHAFGHGCYEDPLYPWISRTLSDERIADSKARSKRLENKAITWLDHVLEYFGGDAQQ
jgi:hypothetical protein